MMTIKAIYLFEREGSVVVLFLFAFRASPPVSGVSISGGRGSNLAVGRQTEFCKKKKKKSKGRESNQVENVSVLSGGGENFEWHFGQLLSLPFFVGEDKKRKIQIVGSLRMCEGGRKC